MDDRIRGRRPMPLDARGPLLGDAMAQYRDWGMTHLEHVFSSDEWQALKEFAEARFAEVKDLTRSHERQIRLVRPHATYPELLRWIFTSVFRQFCESLWQQYPLCIQSQLYLKPAMSSGLGVHQDTYYIKARPSSPLAVWIALEDADEENGCLIVVPGSHTAGPIEHLEGEPVAEAAGTTRQLYTDMHMRLPDAVTPHPVCVREGGCLLFHGDLIHGSLPNLSTSRTRKSLVLHFVPAGTTHLSRFHRPSVDPQGRIVETALFE